MNDNKKNTTCMSCNENFTYTQEDTWWDYKGYTDVKLTRCPYCGRVTVLKYDDSNLDVNNDSRFYRYKR